MHRCSPMAEAQGLGRKNLWPCACSRSSAGSCFTPASQASLSGRFASCPHHLVIPSVLRAAGSSHTRRQRAGQACAAAWLQLRAGSTLLAGGLAVCRLALVKPLQDSLIPLPFTLIPESPPLNPRSEVPAPSMTPLAEQVRATRGFWTHEAPRVRALAGQALAPLFRRAPDKALRGGLRALVAGVHRLSPTMFGPLS